MTTHDDGVAAREVAAGVLERVERDRAFADVALDAALARSRLAPRDRGLAARLVYGTLAWQGRLDWHLSALARRGRHQRRAREAARAESGGARERRAPPGGARAQRPDAAARPG